MVTKAKAKHDDGKWTVNLAKDNPIQDLLEFIQRELGEAERQKLADELLKKAPQAPRTAQIFADLEVQQERLKINNMEGYRETERERWNAARRKSGADL